MNILISGGCGFLGLNLSMRLLKEGHFLTILDNFSSGKRKNIAVLQENCLNPHQLKVIDIDIANINLLSRQWQIALLPPKIDQIYHLACPASPKQYQKDPISTLDTGYLGTKHMLELAKAFKCPILFTSTSECYGDPKVHPQVESYNGDVSLISQRSCYDESKRVAEVLCYEYFHKFGVKCKVVRLFNTYGPWMEPDDGRVISNFITQALNNQPLTIYGDGTQTRSFCYVDDMMAALTLAMNKEDFYGVNPVNLGNPNEFTILNLGGNLVKIMNIPLPVEYRPLPDADPKQRRPDISKAKQLFNWEPKVQLKEGLEKTIPWFKKELGL